MLYISIGSALKDRCWGGNCLKRPKPGKKWQILQSYNMAQLVHYGKIHIIYHTAYFMNTPYDPSLLCTICILTQPWYELVIT